MDMQKALSSTLLICNSPFAICNSPLRRTKRTSSLVTSSSSLVTCFLLLFICNSPFAIRNSLKAQDWPKDSITKYHKVVEKGIQLLDIDPKTTRGKSVGQWTLLKGECDVWVDCWYIEDEERYYTQIMAQVLKLPSENYCELSIELLQINDELFQSSFTIYDGWIWLKDVRESEGMDENEFFNSLTRAGNYAESYYDILKQKYPFLED